MHMAGICLPQPEVLDGSTTLVGLSSPAGTAELSPGRSPGYGLVVDLVPLGTAGILFDSMDGEKFL